MTDERKEFEEEARLLERRTLPAAWRDEIIGVALSEAGRKDRSSWWVPPRWMKVGMAACWVAIGVLHFTRPEPSRVLSAAALEELPGGLPAVRTHDFEETGGAR